ncbi:hypothetical protein [Vibrio diabolicus]|uniref:hypothetical protein n=1 Tax=Vibrio diabolicus TaxID=50719 RepID=UPI0037538DAD
MTKQKRKQNQNPHKTMVVVGSADDYDYKDNRAMKPILLNSDDHPEYQMNYAFQHADSVKLTKKKSLSYFVPNNIALLLSTSRSALEDAEKLYHQTLLERGGSEDKTKLAELWNNCFLVSNYIEKIQTSIVFAYTALEAFANISVPDGYIYTTEKNNKGIKEQFDREALERWLSLKDKLDLVLPKIYNCDKASKQGFWGHFLLLEDFRNKIIHQKSIESTSFYYEYFKPSIFKVLRVAETLICYFHDANAVNRPDLAEANLMWPWLKGAMTAPVMRNPEPVLNWHVDMSQPSINERLTDEQREQLKEITGK